MKTQEKLIQEIVDDPMLDQVARQVYSMLEFVLDDLVQEDALKKYDVLQKAFSLIVDLQNADYSDGNVLDFQARAVVERGLGVLMIHLEEELGIKN